MSVKLEPVGLIGVGLLGSALAERLLAAGYPVVGHDLDPGRGIWLASQGGTAAADLASVAARCRRVLLSLPTSDVAATVVAALLPALRPGDIVIDTTTGAPRQMVELGRRAADRGVDYLDATVVGSSDEARQGRAVVLAGGPRAAFDACGDLFRCFAARAMHLGAPGSGACMKLVVNLVLGLNRAALAEGLALAERLGLDGAAALEALKAGAAYSRAMDAKGDKMLRRDFAPQARLAQHLKDVRLILAAGQAVGARLPLSAVHAELLAELEAAGLGGLDNAAIYQAYPRDGQ